MSHTPGPWHVEMGTRVLDALRHEVARTDGCSIAECSAPRASEECESNARLIAAAPELLAALRFVMAFYDPNQRYLDTEAWKVAHAQAHAALAVAEGRS